MLLLVVRWIAHALILMGVVSSAKALNMDVHIGGFWSAFAAVFLLALGNALVRPIMKTLLLPLNCLTLGLLGFAVNVLMFWLVSKLLEGFDINSVPAAIYCSVLVTFLGAIANSVISSRKED